MKLLITMLLLAIGGSAFANSTLWDNQEVENTYKLTKKITLHFDDEKFILPKDTEFKLIEISELSMIKVHLHKYIITNCPSNSMETDLELISVRQLNRGKTSVGVNLTKGCRIEIFIDMKEYNTLSFLK